MFIPLSDGNSLKHIKLQYVTLIIIAFNCLVWLLLGSSMFYPQETVQAASYSYGFIPAVVNGYQVLPDELIRMPEAWSFVTYSFFHGDFMHLAGNMLFIWVFGDNVEDAFGHLKYFLFYFICVSVGALFHSWVDPQSALPLIGASGAAAGIVGAYILLHPKIRIWILALGRIPLRIPAIFVLGAWILFQIYSFAIDPNGQVSFAAHIGGIIAGMVLIVFFRRKGVSLFDRDIDVVIPSPSSAPLPEQAPSASKTQTPVSRPSSKRPKIKWGRNKG